MSDWDFGDIHVTTGEWWLVIIGLLLLIIGLGLGYWLGYRKGEADGLAAGPWDPVDRGAV